MDYEKYHNYHNYISEQANKLGYTAEWSMRSGWRFQKDNTYIWYCSKGYAVAEVENNYFVNHRYYPSIELALKDEKKGELNG
jgi:hypothetical protein